MGKGTIHFGARIDGEPTLLCRGFAPRSTNVLDALLPLDLVTCEECRVQLALGYAEPRASGRGGVR